MSLIATYVECTGVARIFFDMRPAESSQQDERRIATTIKTAFNLAESEAKQASAPHDHPALRRSSDLIVQSTP
jgi:hypothetical protein